jgi:iron complex outermembrane receptor protein
MIQTNYQKKVQAMRFKRFSRKSYSVFNSLHKVVNTGVVTVSVLLFANTHHLSAQTTSTNPQQQSVTDRELDEVTVTASRVTLPVALTAKSVTVITREEIQRSPIQNLQDLLNYVAGVDIQQRGAHGVQADVSIRGGSHNQSAILLNGINISNPQTGHHSLNLPVNLSCIERIEIIHGPSSLIYGASALSGGINIITRNTPDHTAYGSIQGGMYGLFNAEADGVLKSSAAVHQLSGGYKRADGDRDNSDYRLSNVCWQSHFAVDQSKADVLLGYQDKACGANTFYSAAYPDQYEKNRNTYISVKGETGSALKFIPSIYWNRYDDEFQLIKNDPSKIPFNYHRTNVYGANLNVQYTSGLGITSFGSEFRSESVESSLLGETLHEAEGKYTRGDSRTNAGYVLEHHVIRNRFTVTAGVLASHHTDLRGNYRFYPSVSAAYRLSASWKFLASWSKAARMPTFTELFYTTNTTHIGNPHLKPEHSESFEIGFNYASRIVKGYLTAYLMKGRDMIDWVKASADSSVWYSVNHTAINTRGFDAGLRFNLSELFPALLPATTLQLDYTKQSQSSHAGNLISNYALNCLRDKFVMRLDWPVSSKAGATLSWRWQKRAGTFERYENKVYVETTPYPAFSTLDMQAYYKPGQNLILFINIHNLYNTCYFDLGNVPQPGCWATGGLKYTFLP